MNGDLLRDLLRGEWAKNSLLVYEAVTYEEFDHALGMAGNHFRREALWMIYERCVAPGRWGAPLPQGDWNRLLRWWCLTDGGGVSATRCARMFEAAGFVTDGPPAPTEALTVWRGFRAGHGHGASWTESRDKAIWFAERSARSGYTGVLARAIAPPAAVLGRFAGRQEAEVVVNVRKLRQRVDEALVTGA